VGRAGEQVGQTFGILPFGNPQAPGNRCQSTRRKISVSSRLFIYHGFPAECGLDCEDIGWRRPRGSMAGNCSRFCG
jgi:hypothetical protein